MKSDNLLEELSLSLLGQRVHYTVPVSFLSSLRFVFRSFCVDTAKGSDGEIPSLSFYVRSQGWGYWFQQSGREPVILAYHEVFPALVNATMHSVCLAYDDAPLLHGASVNRDGAAWIFFGRSGSGKSSAVLQSLQHSYPYFSDEIVPLCCEGFGFSTFALPFALKSQSSGGYRDVLHQREGEEVFFYPDSSLISFPGQSLPLGRLVHLCRSDEGEGLCTVSPGRMLGYLLRSVVNIEGRKIFFMESLLKLVEVVPCYQYRWRDYSQLLELIRECGRGAKEREMNG